MSFHGDGSLIDVSVLGGPVLMSLSPRRLDSSLLGLVFSHLPLPGPLSTQVVTEREDQGEFESETGEISPWTR